MNVLKRMASAYVFVYGILYFAAVFFGTKIQTYPPFLSVIMLLAMGVLSWAGLIVKNRLLRIALSILWGLTVMGNWNRLVDWYPPYSEVQYTVMALMNMGQAVSMAVLGEVWRLE